MRKVVGGFRKKSCVSTGVRKQGNIYASQTAIMTLAVKVTLNPNITNQHVNFKRIRKKEKGSQRHKGAKVFQHYFEVSF